MTPKVGEVYIVDLARSLCSHAAALQVGKMSVAAVFWGPVSSLFALFGCPFKSESVNQ